MILYIFFYLIKRGFEFAIFYKNILEVKDNDKFVVICRSLITIIVATLKIL
jgi:hypothetical protein